MADQAGLPAYNERAVLTASGIVLPTGFETVWADDVRMLRLRQL